MHIGMKVRHPELGTGTVKSISEHVADIRFDSGLRSLAPEQSDLEPAEALAEVSGLAMPLTAFVAEIASAIVKEMGLERDDTLVEQLAVRWNKGMMVLRPADRAAAENARNSSQSTTRTLRRAHSSTAAAQASNRLKAVGGHRDGGPHSSRFCVR